MFATLPGFVHRPMFDYRSLFDTYCKKNSVRMELSFEMPEGYEEAAGTFDPDTKTVYINAKMLDNAPDSEKAYFLFHELRHSEQYLFPTRFSEEIRRSTGYVIMYDGTCLKKKDGEYIECSLEGGEGYLKDLYLAQPYEIDANEFAYKGTSNELGDSDHLRALYEFWMPEKRFPEGYYEYIYDEIDKKTGEKKTASRSLASVDSSWFDEKWIRAHLPPDSCADPVDCFFGLYRDGLRVMSEGERGGDDTLVYTAKNEDDLSWWQFEQACRFAGKSDHSAVWRYYRKYAKYNRWYYTEHRRYDYNAIEDPRLPGFELFLKNFRYGGPEDRFKEKVDEYVGLMNYWYEDPHWGYDTEKARFVEISDSKEHDSTDDSTGEPREGSVVEITD